MVKKTVLTLYSTIYLKTTTAKTNGKKDNRQTNSRYARKAWLFKL